MSTARCLALKVPIVQDKVRGSVSSSYSGGQGVYHPDACVLSRTAGAEHLSQTLVSQQVEAAITRHEEQKTGGEQKSQDRVTDRTAEGLRLRYAVSALSANEPVPHPSVAAEAKDSPHL